MKKNNMQPRTNVTLFAIVVVFIICVLTSLSTIIYKLDYSQMISTAGLLLATAAFYGVIYNMNFTAIQLRKTMAKPKIKVAFDENGEQGYTLNYKDVPGDLPVLWLINEGNAVSRYFQIDFIIPENIGKQSVYKSITREDGKYIFSYTNDGKPTLFVNRPIQGPDTNSAIDNKKCIDKNSYEIEYRVYGDWAETQEGKLKVVLSKQEVSPYAHS